MRNLESHRLAHCQNSFSLRSRRRRRKFWKLTMDSEWSLSAMVYPELKTTHRLDYNTNFLIWKSKLDFVFFDYNVEYVLTEPKPPEATDITPEDDVARHKKWVADDFRARHIILGALHDHVYMSYNHHKTAKSLMDALTATFTKPSMSRRMVKLRRYVEHKMAEDKPVNQHILEMGSMAYELECEGLKVPEKLQAVLLMNSLPDSWDESVSGALVNMDMEGSDGMGLDKVKERLNVIGVWKEHYKARDEAEADARSSSTSKGRPRKSFKGHCYTCGKFGHRSADCDLEEDD